MIQASVEAMVGDLTRLETILRRVTTALNE